MKKERDDYKQLFEKWKEGRKSNGWKDVLNTEIKFKDWIENAIWEEFHEVDDY